MSFYVIYRIRGGDGGAQWVQFDSIHTSRIAADARLRELVGIPYGRRWRVGEVSSLWSNPDPEPTAA